MKEEREETKRHSRRQRSSPLREEQQEDSIRRSSRHKHRDDEDADDYKRKDRKDNRERRDRSRYDTPPKEDIVEEESQQVGADDDIDIYGDDLPIREFGYDGYAEKRSTKKSSQSQQHDHVDIDDELAPPVVPEELEAALEDYDNMLVAPGPTHKDGGDSDMEISDAEAKGGTKSPGQISLHADDSKSPDNLDDTRGGKDRKDVKSKSSSSSKDDKKSDKSGGKRSSKSTGGGGSKDDHKKKNDGSVGAVSYTHLTLPTKA